MAYFFDTYAIIEIINQNENYEKFKNETIITTGINLAELHYYFLKNHNEQTADYWLKNLDVELLGIDENIAVQASKFRFKHRKEKRGLSYADCIGYIISKEHNLKFLTGDHDFKEMDKVEFVK